MPPGPGVCGKAGLVLVCALKQYLFLVPADPRTFTTATDSVLWPSEPKEQSHKENHFVHVGAALSLLQPTYVPGSSQASHPEGLSSRNY